MKKKTMWIFSMLIGIVLISGLLWAGPFIIGGKAESVSNAKICPGQGNSIQQFLGVVKGGKFYALWPEKTLTGVTRLTKIQMQEAVSPESGELNLAEFEGKAVMVAGHGGGGGWLYEAQVIDSAGPIVTVLVLEILSKSDN